jgi:hypothetical protein
MGLAATPPLYRLGSADAKKHHRIENYFIKQNILIAFAKKACQNSFIDTPHLKETIVQTTLTMQTNQKERNAFGLAARGHAFGTSTLVSTASHRLYRDNSIPCKRAVVRPIHSIRGETPLPPGSYSGG